MSDKVSERVLKSDAHPLVAFDAQQQSNANEARWKSEIFKKIIEVDNDVQDFLDQFVPTASKAFPPMPKGKRRRPIFCVPHDTPEPDMYPPLVKGLTKLVEAFPLPKRPTFLNYGHKILPFPFKDLRCDHHGTKPDIVATVPTILKDTAELKWRNVGLVIEVKRFESQDPMLEVTERRNSTLVQLAKSARNLMLAQGRLFVLLIGIYGSKARIYRFDRAGAVASRAFDYSAQPAILQEFFWRFVHPQVPACKVVGGDPTVRLATRAQQKNTHAAVLKYDSDHKFTHEDRKACRFIDVTDSNGKTHKYLAYKLLFVNPRLFTRGTAVWEAFELTKKGKFTGKRVVIKNYWRQLARTSEHDIYEEMIDAGVEFFGISKYEFGQDMGALEAPEVNISPLQPSIRRTGMTSPRSNTALKEQGTATEDPSSSLHPNAHKTRSPHTPDATSGRGPNTNISPGIAGDDGGIALPCERGPSASPQIPISPDVDTLRASDPAETDDDIGRGFDNMSDSFGSPLSSISSDIDPPQSVGVAATSPSSSLQSSLSDSEHTPSVPVGHRTVSGWHHALKKHRHHERSHTRIVLSTVGVPLRNFKSTRELVLAFRGAVEGHKRSYLAGVLHRDVSEGNIMIHRFPDRESTGFIQDFDYAMSWYQFLRRRGWQATVESWEQFARTNLGYPDEQAEAQDAETEAARKEMRDCKQRTGTFHFMAMEVIFSTGITHEVRHDLESFFWLLVWMLLRHTSHEHESGRHAVRELFGSDNKAMSTAIKRLWICTENMLTIAGNQPLNYLLEEFRILCQNNESRKSRPADPTSHDKVLKIFDDALAMAGWPTDDAAMPYDRPLNANDEEELALLGQAREKSSLEPSSKPQSTEAYSLDVETGSLAVDLGDDSEADPETCGREAARATVRARPRVQSSVPPPPRRSGRVAFAASAGVSREQVATQPTGGGLSNGHHKGNTATSIGGPSLKAVARRGGRASRPVRGRGAPPSAAPSRSEQPTVAKPRQARTHAAPSPPGAPVRRTRSQTKAATATASQDEVIRTKRPRSADDDEHSATGVVKRSRKSSLSTSRNGSSHDVPGPSKRKGKQRAT